MAESECWQSSHMRTPESSDLAKLESAFGTVSSVHEETTISTCWFCALNVGSWSISGLDMSQPITWATARLEAHHKSTKISCHQARWEGRGRGRLWGLLAQRQPPGRDPALAWPPQHTWVCDQPPDHCVPCPWRLRSGGSTVGKRDPDSQASSCSCCLLSTGFRGEAPQPWVDRAVGQFTWVLTQGKKAYHSAHLSSIALLLLLYIGYRCQWNFPGRFQERLSLSHPAHHDVTLFLNLSDESCKTWSRLSLPLTGPSAIFHHMHTECQLHSKHRGDTTRPTAALGETF